MASASNEMSATLSIARLPVELQAVVAAHLSNRDVWRIEMLASPRSPAGATAARLARVARALCPASPARLGSDAAAALEQLSQSRASEAATRLVAVARVSPSDAAAAAVCRATVRQAFGAGTSARTRFCVRECVRNVRRGALADALRDAAAEARRENRGTHRPLQLAFSFRARLAPEHARTVFGRDPVIARFGVELPRRAPDEPFDAPVGWYRTWIYDLTYAEVERLNRFLTVAGVLGSSGPSGGGGVAAHNPGPDGNDARYYSADLGAHAQLLWTLLAVFGDVVAVEWVPAVYTGAGWTRRWLLGAALRSALGADLPLIYLVPQRAFVNGAVQTAARAAGVALLQE